MIVNELDELPADRVVSGETWISRRLLLASDGMGFSLHDTIIKAGTRTRMHYANHLEAVYCIEGTGRITATDSGKTWEIRPGTVYALNEHDKHVLEADTEMRFVCAFNPPVVGPETHDENGVYPLMTIP